MADVTNVRTGFHRVATDLRRDQRGPVLGFVAGGWFLSVGSRLVFPAILPEFRTAFGLDLSTAGLLLTTVWVAYAIGQLPGGLLADRVGERIVLVVSTAGTGVALGLVVLAVDRATLFAGVAVFGLVTALYGTTRITVLSDLYPGRAGTVIGLTSAAGNVGNSVLPLAAGLLAVVVGWRVGLVVLVPAFLLVAVGLWRTVPERTSGPPDVDDGLTLETAHRVFEAVRQPAVVSVALVVLLGFAVWQGFTGFYPTYLVDVKGLDARTASGLFGLFFAMGLLVEPLAGTGRDRFGTRRVLAVSFGFQVLALVSLQVVEGVVGLVVVTVLLGSILAPPSVAYAHLSSALPAGIQGTALGSIRSMFILLGAASPWVVGSLAERGLFVEAFWLLAGVVALTAALCGFVSEA